jgi:hypothetical protein
VIVPLCSPTPFGVAKVITCTNEGDLELQWLANSNDEPRGTFKPGWTAPLIFDAYYEQEKKHSNHLPYMASEDGIVLNQRDVLLHSFKLTEDQRLPPALIKAISNYDCIWWSDENANNAPAKRKPIVYPAMLK